MEYQTQTDIGSVQVSTRQLQERLKLDKEFFIQFLMYEYLTVPVPQMHIDVFNKMVDVKIKKYVCAIPRGHAKTTLAKLAVVWLFLFSPYEFIVYVSNTSDIAIDACVDIIGFFENPNFIAAFGEVEFIIRRDGEGYYVFKLLGKVCILRARGANQQMRGINVRHRRPQVAVVDDLEDVENIATTTLFDKLNHWYHRTFLKALDQFDSKVVHIGNMISEKCILKNNIESPYWHSTLFGALLSSGEPLWPDLWPLERLSEDFKEYASNGLSHLWFAEMMNQPMMGGNGLIRMEEIQYSPAINPGEAEYGFITCDPAISENTWAHKSSVIAHAWVGDHWQLVEYELEFGIDPLELLSFIITLALKWGFNYVGIESVAYQASLQSLFRYVCLRDGIEHMYVVPLMTGNRSKTQRLASWAAYIKKGFYKLTEGEFVATTQLLQYNPLKKENDDDLIDGAAYSIQMIDLYLIEIVDAVTNAPHVQNQGVYRSMYEISRY